MRWDSRPPDIGGETWVVDNVEGRMFNCAHDPGISWLTTFKHLTPCRDLITICPEVLRVLTSDKVYSRPFSRLRTRNWKIEDHHLDWIAGGNIAAVLAHELSHATCALDDMNFRKKPSARIFFLFFLSPLLFCFFRLCFRSC
jgi:hypothetical protein